ncbi:MAG: hypothetical protein JSV88_22255 [Candidatus Aminicenantes bacterium]|nr:MAG: hypothetical protein JSV88_22255 [Candidatus Aminicenantes bacterium]
MSPSMLLKQLDIDLIMEGSDFYGTMPFHMRWNSDGSRLWFQWKRWNQGHLFYLSVEINSCL